MTVAVLLAANVASNTVLPSAAYVPFALAVALLATWIAWRFDGRSATELGWGRAQLRTGAVWGLGLALLVAATYTLGALLPLTRPLFEDARVADLDGTGVAHQALLWVPLGTVAMEEVLFRSVVLAIFLARTTPLRAVTISSVLFGLWHILPSIGLGDVNPLAEDYLAGPGGTALTILGAVAGTTVAGFVLCWLRLRTGSVLAPMLLHWSTNGFGYLVSWLVLQS